jgi:predicted NAD-dependent protein-ADP-ribosyltransferase YbiA (DUF1768 family)
MADEENENTPGGSPEGKPEESPESTPEETPEETPESTPEETPEETPEAEEEAPVAAPVAAPKKKGKTPKDPNEPKVKKERPIAIPKDSASFFRARKKDPKRFTFTAEGDLQVPEMRGQPAKVIPLPAYRQATAQEQDEGIQKRYDELVGVEKEFDETFRLYKEAVSEWRDTGKASDVLKHQRDLIRLDATRTRLRSPLLWTKEFKRLAIRDVLVDEFYQTKKLGYSAFALRMRSIPFEEFVRIGAAPAEPTPEPEEGEDSGGEEEAAYVFFNTPGEPDHGLLSPDTMVEFVYNSTKYNCLTQAYEGERLKTLGNQQTRAIVLKQRNPTIIRGFATKVVGEVENPRELWIELLKALVAQHPRFGEAVRATGDDTLVYANPKEMRYGIGLAADDPQAMEKGAWKGPNILGQAWQVVRGTLESVGEGVEEEEAAPVSSGGGYTEHGKTTEEAKEIRRNILKGYYRRIAN